MAKFTSYPNKSKPADSDTLLINDASASANKQILLSGLFAWLKDKFTNTPISGLETTNQTIVGAINELKEGLDNIEGGGGSGDGLTSEVKDALLAIFQHVAYADDDGQDYYDALEEALYPTVTTRTVSYSLSHVTSSNNASTVTSGAAYTATLTASSGYTINTVTVTMGGADVTSTVYSSGTITIPSVTGNIVITATAVASVSSITAVYTQSGTVYETDTLNDLKSDLVVTAHYSDNTSHAVTDYTLSGTLAAGTSTIAVTYGGKTTTFTVTVTGALYPLENGTHTFTANDRVLTVTNGKHFVYEWPNATTAAVNGAYLNLSTVSDNDTSAKDASNVLVSDPLFTIPANAQVVFEIKNISFSNVGTAGSSNKYAFNMRNGATSLGMWSGDKGISDAADISIEKTFDVDTPATCISLYVSRQFSRFEADISLTVNGVRWI